MPLLDCGLTHVHDADVKKMLLEVSPQEKDTIESMKFGEITKPYVTSLDLAMNANDPSRIEETVKEDVAILRASPFVRQDVQIVGLKWDTFTGALSVVEESNIQL
jgi:carbonic anhydrase